MPALCPNIGGRIVNRVPVSTARAKQAQQVLVGAVLRPRGLKGELKVQILTNKLDIFSAVKTVFIDNKKYTVLRGSVQNGYAYLLLCGVAAVETAEKFRSKEIYVNADDIELQEDEVLSTVLIGFSVLNESGDKIGIVKNIENFGGGDFFEIAVTPGAEKETDGAEVYGRGMYNSALPLEVLHGTPKTRPLGGGEQGAVVNTSKRLRTDNMDAEPQIGGYIQIPNEDEFIIETNMTNKTITVRNVALQCETIL
jgi:16S rRNA processing protein RimM